MSTAKVTSFIGGLFYLLAFGSSLLYSQSFSKVLNNSFGVENSTLFALILASAFLFAVGNFCFSYLVQQREHYHEKMENALFFSLQLLILPAILVVGFIVIFVSLS